jgi:hypothetical protein
MVYSDVSQGKKSLLKLPIIFVFSIIVSALGTIVFVSFFFNLSSKILDYLSLLSMPILGIIALILGIITLGLTKVAKKSLQENIEETSYNKTAFGLGWYQIILGILMIGATLFFLAALFSASS